MVDNRHGFGAGQTIDVGEGTGHVVAGGVKAGDADSAEHAKQRHPQNADGYDDGEPEIHAPATGASPEISPPCPASATHSAGGSFFERSQPMSMHHSTKKWKAMVP